ncbi:MAG: NGG1p interacting factor 3 protein [Clostridia bacterium]|jgi:dinuclear metal center YbgI/SA1388 family protein|nr:NGG1p interacting factor 3 protein [Clostridia bacterium]
MYLLNDIIKTLESIAPPELAEKWDNVGLMIGSRNQPIKKVLCALDINEEVIEEAIQNNVECIITHHPLFFKPIHQIDFETPKGRLIKRLICSHISVYAMHTNYDSVHGGINDILCHEIGIGNTKVLHPTYTESRYKIAVYVPEGSWESVRQALIECGVCSIGNYKGCTFMTQGEGTFIPLEGSNPYLGETGRLEYVKERKIECIVNEKDIESALEAIRQVHPYEEPAFDIYRLENLSQVSGFGRYGDLQQELSIEAFIIKLKKIFGLSYVRVTPFKDKTVKRIAVCSGSGAEFIKRASHVAEVYVTGDLKFHEAQEACALGLTVIDIGHYASEHIAMKFLAGEMNNRLKDLEIRYSLVDGEAIRIQ